MNQTSNDVDEGSSPSPADNVSLDERLSRLERIVRELERDDQQLDDALRLFEEGVEHVRAAREALSRSELRIENLVSDAEVEEDDSFTSAE
ncbi:MAG: exodeoxyribonuclease VII small subunit [Gemmatimonadota bacterium]